MNRLHFFPWLRPSLGVLMLLAGVGSQACAPVDDFDPESVGQDESAPTADQPELAERVDALSSLVGFSGCRSWETQALVNANTGAWWLIDNALDNFHSPTNIALRIKWFGESRNDWAIWLQLLIMLEYTDGRVGINVWCEPYQQTLCKPGAYAYRVNDKVLHICPPYFNMDHNQADYAPTYGVSQVGGLLHEVAHYAGSPPDGAWGVYGYDGCAWLASNWPQDAFNNADNWRYYLMQVP